MNEKSQTIIIQPGNIEITFYNLPHVYLESVEKNGSIKIIFRKKKHLKIKLKKGDLVNTPDGPGAILEVYNTNSNCKITLMESGVIKYFKKRDLKVRPIQLKSP